MMMIDTHAHLADAVFRNDRGIVLARARENGVRAVISVGETLSDSRLNLKLAAIHPEILPAAGLYPAHTDPDQVEAVIAFIQKEQKQLVAIGEVGLDYWLAKTEAERKQQRYLFERFIDLALELDLPLNVHSRSAGKDAIALLLEKGARRVQLHAFDGKASTARPAVDAGFFFSIPPSVVRSGQKQKLVKQLPLEALLLETDSPVLGPDADSRNEPANLLQAVQVIAEIKGVDPVTVKTITTANTRRLYAEQLPDHID
jgi:TatD DNase family protein